MPTIFRRVDFPGPPLRSTVSPTCLPTRAIVSPPRTIWFGSCSPWPLRSGGATAACRLVPMIGNAHAVDLGPGEVDARRRRDVVVVGKQTRALLCRQVFVAGEPREQRVIPVPSVQSRVRHEIVQTGAEHHRAQDHDDGERRAQHGRPDRDGVTVARIDGEADAGDCGHGEAGRRRQTRPGGGAADHPPARTAEAEIKPVRLEDGDSREHDHQGRQPENEHRCIDGDAHGIDGAHGSEREQRRQGDGDGSGQDAADEDRTDDARDAIGHRHGGAGAERAEQGRLVGVPAQLPTGDLQGDEEQRQCRQPSEHAERD